MKIPFACPACGASGLADEALIGRQVRCKACQHRFVIPDPVEQVEDAGYLLDQPIGAGTFSPNSTNDPVFVPSRGDEPSVYVAPRKPRSIKSSMAKKARRDGPEIAWGTWLIRIGLLVAVAIGAIALFAPRGPEIAGSTLVFLGTALFAIGFAAGAYGAFSEDFLYGFLYVVLPVYTAYYLVTRWEDLWKWSACSVLGVLCVSVGTAMLRSAGVAE